MTNYRDKYIKYKTKYIELKNIQIGSSIKSAKEALLSFISKLSKKDSNEKEKFLKKIQFPDAIELLEDNINNNTDKIFEHIMKILDNCKNNSVDNKKHKINLYAHFLVAFYINNEHINKEELNSFLCKCYELKDKIKINLLDLTKYNDYLVQINEKYAELEIKRLNTNDIITVLKTPNLIIYQPKTIEASGCYGRNTKWCTRKITDYANEFRNYTEKGPLYIIIPRAQLESKSDEEKYESYKEKYQFHFESREFKDEMNDDIDPYILIEERFNDDIFREWVKEKIKIISNSCEEYKNKPESKESEKIIINDHIQLLCFKYLCDNPNIKSITFKDYFVYETLNGLPNYELITELNLGGGKNIDYNNLPKNLKIINFPVFFNEPIVKLPRSLETITFGNYFNQKLPLNFKSMKKLNTIKLGSSFNQTVENLPIFLETITFGNYFNQKLPLNFQNMDNLKTINFSYYFNQTVENLPSSLETITLGSYFNQKLPLNFQNMDNLKIINLGHMFNETLENLPSSLETITLGEMFNRELPDNFKSMTNLKTLQLGHHFNQSLDNLPNSLETITLGNSFNQKLPNNFKSMTKLNTINLGNNFNQTLENLPSSLKLLKLGNSFNMPLNNLPKNLQKIFMGDSFNTSVDFSNLNELSLVNFGKNFMSSFKLPTSIKEIFISSNYEITDPNPNYQVHKLNDDEFQFVDII